MPDENADLTFLARQIERLLTNDRQQADDMRVLTAMMLRLDGTMRDLLNEMRAMHTQIARMNDRITKPENAQSLS